MKAYVALTIKSGTYDEVIKKLLVLNIPRRNIINLFGPIDILVQFIGLESLEEFRERWFNPILEILGAEEPLITKTQTFIVNSEGPSFMEEPFAFIFLNIQPQSVERVREALLTIPEVLSADSVFGSYDVICSVLVSDRVDLKRVTSYIRSIPSVEGTMTTVVAIVNSGVI